MLENALQAIACDFVASQGHRDIPSWAYGIATCGWAFILHWSAMDLEVSESQKNAVFHRIVWPGLIVSYNQVDSVFISFCDFHRCDGI